MSYALIKTGGKQYKVKSGEILKIEKLPDSKPNSKIEFNEILAYGDDKTIEVGAPTVEGAKVEADLIKNYPLNLSILKGFQNLLLLKIYYILIPLLKLRSLLEFQGLVVFLFFLFFL